MLSFNINGKDFSNDDVNLLVCHDHIKDFTEVKMYCNDEEIQVNDSDSDIEIKINIVSDRMNNHTGKTKSLGERLNKLERVIAVIREEMNELRKNYNGF